MNKRKKIRLSCSLCLSFARNYALYLAAWNNDGTSLIGGKVSQLTPDTHLKQLANINVGNLIDIATLEWCKLFGNYKSEKLHWKRVIKNKSNYKSQLLDHFDQNEKNWSQYHKSILSYRNEHVAHIDETSRPFVPHLEKALLLIFSHYNYLMSNESVNDTFTPSEKSLSIEGYFNLHEEIGKKAYPKFNNLMD